MRAAREKETPVYLESHARGEYAHGSSAMHRPHGTIQRCNIFSDPYAPVHRRENNRYYNDERPLPPSSAERPHRPSVPAESRAEDFHFTKKAVSNVKPPPQREADPFRLGGRLGGSGAPGFKAARHGGLEGDSGWSRTVECNINCAREVRQRLHVKAVFAYSPPAVLAFHDK